MKEKMVMMICDEDRLWCLKCQGLLETYAEKKQIRADIHAVLSAGELEVWKEDVPDVLFLDVELEKGKTGIRTAAEVNGRWPKCLIVYVTRHMSYATDVYDTEHLLFVHKEQFEERLPQIFRKIGERRAYKERNLLLPCIGGRSLQLAPEEIYYFERRRRQTFVTTAWGEHRLKERLEEILPRLSEEVFVRCHNSYVVCLPNVREFLKSDLVMKNDARIPISRAFEKHTKGSVEQWIRKRLL